MTRSKDHLPKEFAREATYISSSYYMTYSVVHDVANRHETPNDLVYVTVALKCKPLVLLVFCKLHATFLQMLPHLVPRCYLDFRYNILQLWLATVTPKHAISTSDVISRTSASYTLTPKNAT